MKEKKKIFLSILLIIMMIIVSCGIKEGNYFNNAEQNKTEITFPYELEEGKLLINSLFQSTVENPDSNNEIGEDIASLEITNQSEEYCKKAEISLTMQDGTKYRHIISDIPAGKTVWAFELDNQTLTQDNICIEIKCEAEFVENSMMDEYVAISVNDTVISIQNLTDEEINHIAVYCHCLFENAYFGGKSYCYQIETLPANEETAIEAVDCYMGTAEVVCIVND